jgi:apolipoprotein N-acyltransferase
MFNLAFFFPEQCGFLILFFLIPLGLAVATTRHGWRLGFVWGLCIFAPHFSWLLLVMLQNSEAVWWLAVIVYMIIVVCFSATSACWLWLTSLVPEGMKRKLWFIVTTIGYWSIAINWVVRPLGLAGYPFINPLLPLTVYRPFLKGVALVAMLAGRPCSLPRYDLNSVVYCSPVVNRVINAKACWRTDAYAVGKRIYEELATLHTANSQNGLYVTPESMYCFRLNYHPEVVTMWGRALLPEEDLLMGSVIERTGRYYQAVFWLRKGLIINFYVKKMLTPFVEKIPTLLKTFESLKQPFLSNTVEFCDGTQGFGAELFDIGPRLRVIPRICLEFFFCSAHDFDTVRVTDRDAWIFVFANDSWFDRYFRKILFLTAVLKANYSGLPILYSGHFGCHRIIPQGA